MPPTLTTLINFNGTDGSLPGATLITDAAGDLFGTTGTGGANNDGTVFEVVKSAGTYATTPVQLGHFNIRNGSSPYGSLLADSAGDLFGTTNDGGASSDGTIFEIAKSGGSYGTLTDLVSFNNTDGQAPTGDLLTDSAGDLLGTASTGGANNDGVVFELARTGATFAATPTVLTTFNNTDGALPDDLLSDASGLLYGTTAAGGASSDGTVFEIARTGNGYATTPIVLVTFNGTNGASPGGGLVSDSAGDLFGTTIDGGAHSNGTVFEIVRTANGYASSATTLAAFGGTDDTSQPQSGLVIDAAGDLFGTTAGDSNANGKSDGTVFEIKNAGGYLATPVILATFTGTNGNEPLAGLTADAAGNLYGTTSGGGTNNDGTVFEITNSGYQVACYHAGTRIRTITAETPVEDLRIGNLLPTWSGDLRPIKWIGRRSYRHPLPDQADIVPVCIHAGALGKGLPVRDLVVSPLHALLIDGVLIPAGQLVNGLTVTRLPALDPVRYFHIELDSHDIIFAEGTPAETFVDCDSRAMFVNAAEFHSLYPADTAPAWQFCAPRIESGARLRHIWRNIAARAGMLDPQGEARTGHLDGRLDHADQTTISGWAWEPARPDMPVELEVLDGEGVIARIMADRFQPALKRAGIANGRHHFHLTLPTPLTTTHPHHIHVRRAADKTELKGSPMLV